MWNSGDKMISDKKFSEKDFHDKLQEMCQQLANKIPGAEVRLGNDPLSYGNSYLVSIETKDGKSGTFGITLHSNGQVESSRIIGV